MRIALTLDRDMSREKQNDYVNALLGVGFRREEIVVLPPGSGVGPGEDFDGVVLGGGVDVDPAKYGQATRPEARVEVDPDRDRTDFELLDWARRTDTPTLAICRGLQVLNVALGGTLVQDLPTEQPAALAHESAAGDENAAHREHDVRLTPGTRLARIAGAGEISVNSRHHQAIARPAPALTISAVAPDGVVEAVELDEPWTLAVQWHPENLASFDAPSREIFAEFARVVRARASERAAAGRSSREA